MRLKARLVTLLVTSLVFIGVLCGFRTALKIRYRKAIGLLPSRLVVFGDEWSGILPPETLRKRSKIAPGHVWTELLCSHIHAECHSFAPSPTHEVSTVERGVYGAAVDNIIFNQTSTVPDLRTQVATWIEAERKSRGAGVKQERSSMFTVFFGVNDVWKYSGYNRVDGVAAVDASLDSMFEQLDLVDEHWPDPIQVLVPYLLDVTMLPGWKRVRHFKDKREEQLKNAVYLTKRWNHGLDIRVRDWKRGKVMLWDMNKWLLDAIRNEAKDGWYEVKEGCAKSQDDVCERPEEFLMWDDIHLGPRAHEKLSQAVVQYLL